jgi:hypothetical protein
MEYRAYDLDRDFDAVVRIFREIGWLKDEEAATAVVRRECACGTGLLAMLRGEPECLAMTHDGVFRHGEADLPLCIVSAVATSRIARQQGLAGRLTAEAIAQDHIENGSLVAALGIFDQGFYDRIGFGTGTYDNVISFDPASLLVNEVAAGPPVRLGADDTERIHRARTTHAQGHGSIVPRATDYTHSQMNPPKGFGLGYEDPATGELMHHFWAFADDLDNGPYRIAWLCFRTPTQFRELMNLVRGLGDQVKLVRMIEPPGVQMQDLLQRPIRGRAITRRGPFENRCSAIAWWQARILDLPGCLERTRLPATEEATFRLALEDPIEAHLSADTRARWAGVGGDWIVTLGAECHAEKNSTHADLPTIRTSVGTFTRLWLGVKPPTGLALTCADLDAPPELLERLDRILLLPEPHPAWDM